MKINSVSPLNYYQNSKSLKTVGKSSNYSSVNFKGENNIDPLHYRAFYLIFPNSPIYINGKLENGEDFSIQIEDEFADKFLRDGKGKIKETDFKKFIEIQDKIANEMNKKFHNELGLYDNKSKKSAISLIIEAINPELKEITKSNILKIPFFAYEKTKRYFELSQTTIGLDLSDYERKMKLIDDIEFHTNNDLYPHDEDVTYEQILECGMNKYGRLDYDLIYDTFDITSVGSFCESFKDAINKLKKYYSYDENSKPQIKCAMANLNEGYFDIDPYNETFDILMNLCFDKNKKFNAQKETILRDACEIMSLKIDEVLYKINYTKSDGEGFPEDYSENPEDDPDSMYQDVVNTGAYVITQYFDEITDIMGNLKLPRQSFEEYINEKYGS